MSTVAGETALEISMASANADIVTLLRLAKLNDEIKETDLANPGKNFLLSFTRNGSLYLFWSFFQATKLLPKSFVILATLRVIIRRI